MKKSLIQILLAVYLVFLVSLLVLAGLGFLIASLYLYLATLFTPWSAGLITGAIILAAVLLLLLAVWLATRLRAQQSPTPAAGGSDRGGSEFAGLLQDILKKSDMDARELSLYALVAGGMLGASPDLRRFLVSLMAAEKGGRPPGPPEEEQ